jgi:hypothetical protein
MPFLAIVHLRELRCRDCGAVLAGAGARSFIVDAAGFPASFATGDPPAEMTVELTCPDGHAVALLVPNEIAAEEALLTPGKALIAADARLLSGTTESGAPLSMEI